MCALPYLDVARFSLAFADVRDCGLLHEQRGAFGVDEMADDALGVAGALAFVASSPCWRHLSMRIAATAHASGGETAAQ
jgi:hypothetical protein